MNGQGVNGTVVFVSPDGTSKESPITPTDGSYMITGAPKGEVSILVKGGGGMGGPAISAPKDGSKDAMSKTMGGGTGQGVAPPPKYAKPDNGLPKLTVTGGRQTHNIELTP